jgi:membrane-bound metal-dependent hydrolase YbcI (DUF457 family)
MEAMPFTPAHAAAALPFLRLRLVPSALVVGTMAPDFEYFLRFAPGGGFGHTLPGAFLLSLPLALMVLWIFHALLKRPVVRLFPDGLRLRIAAQSAPFRFGGARRFVLIVVSALIGIATHLLWDCFTHRDMWASRHFPWLREEERLPILGMTAHYAMLQLGSTVLGILILCLWGWRWYRRSIPMRQAQEKSLPAARRHLVVAGIAVIALTGGAIRAMAAMRALGRGHGWVIVAGDGATSLIALAWWALVVYAAIAGRHRARQETQP